MIDVRLAMPYDKDEVIELARMQTEECHPHLDFRPDLVAATFDASVTTADPTCFVADQNGVVIGFLWARIYEYAFSSGVFVSQEVLYVRPDKRGTRAAVKLIDEYKRWGETVGAREILFGISTGYRMESALKLFKHCGADHVGYHLRIVRDGTYGKERGV